MSADLERALGDAIADGRATEHDADAVRAFAELLGKLGPRRMDQPGTLDADQLDAVADYYDDQIPELADAATAMRARAAWMRERARAGNDPSSSPDPDNPSTTTPRDAREGTR